MSPKLTPCEVLGFRVCFDRQLDDYNRTTVRPNRGSMFFEKEDGAGIGWTDHDSLTHISKYMGFRLVRDAECEK